MMNLYLVYLRVHAFALLLCNYFFSTLCKLNISYSFYNKVAQFMKPLFLKFFFSSFFFQSTLSRRTSY